MRREGFSLVEISVVLVIVATMLAGVLPAITESQKTNASTETIDRMEAIEQAILTYRAGQNRIPCPASLTLSVNVGNFGKEGATPGTCTGGTPAATFGPAGQVVAGGVPVKTLGLPDEYAFDGWGRRFVYYVDKQLTLGTSYATTMAGSITIMDGAATPTVRSATAAYALLSPGPNGHGGYTRSGTRFSFGTTNTRELENCDCTNAAANGTFNATLHQYMATTNTDPKETFDDIVRYGSRPSLDLLAGAGSSFWAANGTSIYNTNTGSVGIGTTNPIAGLHVHSSDNSAPANYIILGHDRAGAALQSGDWLGSLQFRGESGSGSSVGVDLLSVASTAPSGGHVPSDFVVRTLPSGGPSLLERMRITSTGNVGIGTTPAAKLDVAGGVKLGTTAAACTAAIAGTLRYNAGAVEFCNGTAWGGIGGGGGASCPAAGMCSGGCGCFGRPALSHTQVYFYGAGSGCLMQCLNGTVNEIY